MTFALSNGDIMTLVQSVLITELLQRGIADFEIKEFDDRCRLVFSNSAHVDIYADGTKYWFQNGKQHRLDGPAVEFADGSKYWCQNGKLHRLDGPAVEHIDGSKRWYKNDKRVLLRHLLILKLKKLMIYVNWFQNGKQHRLDVPAVEHANGFKYWCKNGVKIRTISKSVVPE